MSATDALLMPIASKVGEVMNPPVTTAANLDTRISVQRQSNFAARSGISNWSIAGIAMGAIAAFAWWSARPVRPARGDAK